MKRCLKVFSKDVFEFWVCNTTGGGGVLPPSIASQIKISDDEISDDAVASFCIVKVVSNCSERL